MKTLIKPVQTKVIIKENKRLKPDVFCLKLTAPEIAACAVPGTFLQIKIPNTVLRRPISVHSVKGETVELLVRIRG